MAIKLGSWGGHPDFADGRYRAYHGSVAFLHVSMIRWQRPAAVISHLQFTVHLLTLNLCFYERARRRQD